jgi:single-strand DNA-binding protein
VQSNNYDKYGETVYAMAFTAEEIGYLDTKAEGEALRAKQGTGPDEGQPMPQAKPAPVEGAKGKGRKTAAATAQAELDEHGDPIPF